MTEPLTEKLLSCYKVKGFSSLLVCFAFIVCSVMTFIRYIRVDLSGWILRLGFQIAFVITKISLYRTSLNRGSTVLAFYFRATLLTECWRKDPDHRPEPGKILELLSAHPAMVTACLDSPMSSVVTDDDCVGPDDMRNGSLRTWRGTPSPALKRSRTITQLTQDQIKVLMPHRENGGTAVDVV